MRVQHMGRYWHSVDSQQDMRVTDNLAAVVAESPEGFEAYVEGGVGSGGPREK